MNSPISTLNTFTFCSDPANISAHFLRNFYQRAYSREPRVLVELGSTQIFPHTIIPWSKEEVAVKSFTNSAAVIDERVLLDDCRAPLQLFSWHEKKILWPLLCMLANPFDPSSTEELILRSSDVRDPTTTVLETLLSERLRLLTSYMQTGLLENA